MLKDETDLFDDQFVLVQGQRLDFTQLPQVDGSKIVNLVMVVHQGDLCGHCLAIAVACVFRERLFRGHDIHAAIEERLNVNGICVGIVG